MTNSAVIDNNIKTGSDIGIADRVRFLPQWEIIKEFNIKENKYLFFKKPLKVNLLKKFSEKTLLEKYSVRTLAGAVLADMDIKVYKDSVYIVNFEISAEKSAKSAAEKLLQISAQEAACSGTSKDVFINILPEQKNKKELKKLLLKFGFEAEQNQSACEQKIFGETFRLSFGKCRAVCGQLF